MATALRSSGSWRVFGSTSCSSDNALSVSPACCSWLARSSATRGSSGKRLTTSSIMRRASSGLSMRRARRPNSCQASIFGGMALASTSSPSTCAGTAGSRPPPISAARANFQPRSSGSASRACNSARAAFTSPWRMASAPAALRMVSELGARCCHRARPLAALASSLASMEMRVARSARPASPSVCWAACRYPRAASASLPACSANSPAITGSSASSSVAAARTGALGGTAARAWPQARDSSRTLGMRINAGIVGIGALKCRPMASSLSQATEQ